MSADAEPVPARIPFPLVLVGLLACSGASGPSACDGTVVTVHPQYTTKLDGAVVPEECYTVSDEGIYDFAPCCPEGYSFLGISGDGSVLCEETCGGSS